MKPRIVFFGTPDYSLIVLNRLYNGGYPIVEVVTKPPRSISQKQVLTPTPVAVWASAKQIPILTPISDLIEPWLFANEEDVINQVRKYQPDLLVTADYAQKIPLSLISHIPYGGVNIHPSLLPAYRGPAPVPWVILNDETDSGVSIVTLTEKFDQGQIVAQEKIPIQPSDTTPILLERLFKKGADLLLKILPAYLKYFPKYEILHTKYEIKPSYFPRLTRDHGFESWLNIKQAIENGTEAIRIERKWRALFPWPGLWTIIKLKNKNSKVKTEKRLKILKVHLQPKTYPPKADQPWTGNLQLDKIQLEGKQPISGKDATSFLNHFLEPATEAT